MDVGIMINNIRQEAVCGMPGTAEPQLGKSLNRGWYSRGYLPHHDEAGLRQCITYHLADSLPSKLLSMMERELKVVAAERMPMERRRYIEHWLDTGHGSCALRNSEVAQCVVDTWKRFDDERYDLIAWVVMPNHVHVLIRQYADIPLGKIVQSWKSYTAKKIREIEDCRAGARRSGEEEGKLARAGARRSGEEAVWQREYWDRSIRDEKHYRAVVNYIHQNPVEAGLVRCASDWPWSSFHEHRSCKVVAQ